MNEEKQKEAMTDKERNDRSFDRKLAAFRSELTERERAAFDILLSPMQLCEAYAPDILVAVAEAAGIPLEEAKAFSSQLHRRFQQKLLSSSYP